MGSVNAYVVADDELIAAVRAGCTQSFGLLIDRYYSRIQTYLVRQTRDHHLAADLTQQTFLEAFRSCARLPDASSFPAWLYRIALNLTRHEWRRGRVRYVHSLEWVATEAGLGSEVPTSPDQTDECHERMLVQQVLAELNPALREVLLLSSLAGFRSKEIAYILTISDMAARQRISRAKQEFRLRYNILSRGNDDEEMFFSEYESGGVC